MQDHLLEWFKLLCHICPHVDGSGLEQFLLNEYSVTKRYNADLSWHEREGGPSCMG